jgi:gliding motility-associated lipoprotein GldH
MATGRKPARSIIFLMVVLLAVSCQSDILFTGHNDFNQDGWSRHNEARFMAEITDTITASRVDITIRTGSDYPYRNIFLFVSAHSPGGERITDTLEYMLADEKGNRLGQGTGDIRELNLNYRRNVYFPVSGTYTFVIEHAMRTETLEGVYDVGLRIMKESGKKR